jgi:hypothetical protein
MMTDVLRMENDAGLGPFMDQDTEGFAQHVPWATTYDVGFSKGLKAKDDAHPHHMHDIPDANLGSDFAGAFATRYGGSTWRVGVKNMAQFEHWFPRSSWHWFASKGFHLDEYSVPSQFVRLGKWQLMFDKAHAHLLQREPLDAPMPMQVAA